MKSPTRPWTTLVNAKQITHGQSPYGRRPVQIRSPPTLSFTTSTSVLMLAAASSGTGGVAFCGRPMPTSAATPAAATRATPAISAASQAATTALIAMMAQAIRRHAVQGDQAGPAEHADTDASLLPFPGHCGLGEFQFVPYEHRDLLGQVLDQVSSGAV